MSYADGYGSARESGYGGGYSHGYVISTLGLVLQLAGVLAQPRQPPRSGLVDGLITKADTPIKLKNSMMKMC